MKIKKFKVLLILILFIVALGVGGKISYAQTEETVKIKQTELQQQERRW